MQTTLTGTIESINDASKTITFVSIRRGLQGPVYEKYALHFKSQLAFAGMAARHAPGSKVAVIGEVGQHWHGPGYTGPCNLVIWVQDYHPAVVDPNSIDLNNSVGLIRIRESGEITSTPVGLANWRGSGLSESPNKAGQTQPGDCWGLEAFGSTAERLASCQPGETVMVTQGYITNEGTGPRIVVRDFRHVPQWVA